MAATRADNPVRFCVLTTQRSGSTWLIDLLASHPRVRAYTEVFIGRQWTEMRDTSDGRGLYDAMQPDLYFFDYRDQQRRPRPWVTWAYVDHLCRPSPEYDAVGWKLMYNQLKAWPELAWQWRRDAIRVIHLVRENYIDVLISEELRRRRHLAHTAEELPPMQVRLEPDRVCDALYRAQRRRRRGEWLLRWSGVHTLPVVYERLCEHTEEVMAEISAFLSVPPAPLHSRFRKMNRLPHWSSLSNYDEVRAALRGTAYEGLLAVPEEAHLP